MLILEIYVPKKYPIASESVLGDLSAPDFRYSLPLMMGWRAGEGMLQEGRSQEKKVTLNCLLDMGNWNQWGEIVGPGSKETRTVKIVGRLWMGGKENREKGNM